jgi:hypothetical protein
VQLAAADQDDADLRQLAGIAAATVRLDVDGEELRLGGGCGEQIQTEASTPAPGRFGNKPSSKGLTFA